MDRVRETNQQTVTRDCVARRHPGPYSFPPPHPKSSYIRYYGALKIQCLDLNPFFFFAKNYDLLTVSTKCRDFDRGFGLNLFEKFFEKLRFFVLSIIGRKYCRCRRADRQVRVLAQHWRIALFI
jgi:hypothetical protein